MAKIIEPMKIGIDARMYGPKNSGLGRYVEQLIKHLLSIDSQNEYVLFCLKNNIPKLEIPNCKLKIISTEIKWYSWQEQIMYSGIINKENVDIMHFPHWNVPIFYNKPFVVTIHDLIMYHYPRIQASTHGPLVYWIKDKLHRYVLNSATKKAKAIITPSGFTKQDLVKTLKINPDKITVTHLAPYNLPSMANDQHNTTHLLDPYVLYVGNAYPHKNLNNLIKAWKIFCQKYTNKYKLVLVGKQNYFYNRLLNSNKTMKQLNNIIYLGYQTDEELSNIYKNASLYVFPSLYEGFGLPPLEAMQYDVPVVSSNSSCLPEILQKSAIYFNPNDTNDIANKINLILTDKDLLKNIKQESKELLKQYSWHKTAQKTLKLYSQIQTS